MEKTINTRVLQAVLIGLGISAAAALFLKGAIPQSAGYHSFADETLFFGTPNFWNVWSNLPFVLLGGYGMRGLAGHKNLQPLPYRLMAWSLFGGIALIGLGSAYYHYAPNHWSLVFDRLPMAVVFVAFFSMMLIDFAGEKTAYRVFGLFMALGLFSVPYWYWTETLGRGDLRLYAFVQFYPMLALPLVLWGIKGKVNYLKEVGWVLLWYLAAKAFEHFDFQMMGVLGFGGHAAKHLAAAAATYFIYRFFVKREEVGR